MLLDIVTTAIWAVVVFFWGLFVLRHSRFDPRKKREQ